MSLIVLTPKGPFLGGTTSFEPQNVNISCAVGAGRWKKKKKTVPVHDRTGQEKGNKSVTFHLFGDKLPLKRSVSKIV